MGRPYFIAIAGGSSSGKTTLARALKKRLGPDQCDLIPQDNYYFGRSECDNFDLPEAIEHGLLAQHLRNLKDGKVVKIPTYDFTSHSRKQEELLVTPKPVMLIEGTLVLHWQELQPLFDLTVFVDCDQQARLKRRIRRDTADRGRLEHDVLKQFSQQVEPCHKRYIEPSKADANVVIDGAQAVLNEAVELIINTDATIKTLAKKANIA